MKALKHLAYAGFFAALATSGAAQQADPAPDEAQTQALAGAAIVAQDATASEAEAAGEAEAATEEPDLILDASETTLEEWLWIKRPVVVFADNPADPRYVEQIGLITARLDALAERDVVVITDTDPSARSAVRQKLRARGFMLVIIAKDGTIVTRKPAPWNVREISRSIDKLPLRQQEIRDRRDGLR